MTLAQQIQAAASLVELRDTLNAWIEAREQVEPYNCERIEDNCDIAGLPVFGGEEPRDTAHIWSWDAANLLRWDDYQNRYVIETR